jgi:molybdate transport system substrate-binding protein
MTMRRRRAAVVVAALLLGLLTACSSAGDPAADSTAAGREPTHTTLTVLAAASLTETFTTLAHQFEADHPGVTVRLSIGASSALAQQVVAGAPADVFASANEATMTKVADAGQADAPVVFATNTLEIAVPPSNPAGVTGLADLEKPDVKVALCAPQVPCGAAAATVLQAAGLRVKPVSLEQDVKAVLTKVRLGEVDAGLVYTTDVVSAGADVTGIAVPQASGAVNSYPVTVLRQAKQPALAREFVALLTGPEGAHVFSDAGFVLP